MTLILFSMFFALLILGVPIFITLILPSLTVVSLQSMDTMIIIQRMVGGLDKSSILAVPFFMFCAEIMSVGQIGRRLINLAKAFLGHLPGGIAIATVVACTIFGAISGAGSAAVVAIGAIVYAMMKDSHYDTDFSSGVILTSSTLAMLIPPSIAYVLYSTITLDSIKALFMSGMQAGLICCAALMIYSFLYAKKKNFEVLPKASWGERGKALKESLLSLGMIVIILGGIYGGLCTATEAAALAVVYAILVEIVIYRSITLKQAFLVAVRSGRSIAMVMILIAAGSVLSWVITAQQIPQMLISSMSGASKTGVLLFINLIFLIAGMFVDPNSAVIVLTPLVQPLAVSFGVDSVHLATIIVVNLAIGMLTPPFGMNLFIGINVLKKDYGSILKGVIPFIIICLLLLLLFTFIPSLSLAFPQWLVGYQPR